MNLLVQTTQRLFVRVSDEASGGSVYTLSDSGSGVNPRLNAGFMNEARRRVAAACFRCNLIPLQRVPQLSLRSNEAVLLRPPCQHVCIPSVFFPAVVSMATPSPAST
ncbi:uncharacterized protein V6R79_020884 [Siganus canaliculatus]